MNASAPPPPLRVGSVASLLSAVPHLLGFHPENSLVAVAVSGPVGRVCLTMRYDLPDPPSNPAAEDIAAHLAAVLRQHADAVVLIGYGPGPLVTPVADAARQRLDGAGPAVRDVLRVEEGRYWSYLCQDPSCCPPEGVAFDPGSDPASRRLTESGMAVVPSRSTLAATIAPVTGWRAAPMPEATRWAEREAAQLADQGGQQACHQRGLTAVQEAIRTYQAGSSITAPASLAWLAVSLTWLPVRDDAWARMDPSHRHAHRRLWTDLVRRAQPGYVAAPACLLAFTCWQGGEGALANMAVERALADAPGYTMASLLQAALESGMPPSMATLPMTPEEVAASYAEQVEKPDKP